MIFKRMEFEPNNILLREVSSLCIAKYKQSQAIALSQVQQTVPHKFSTTAREILLLNYDMWFRWIIEVEDVLRRNTVADNIPHIIMRISDDMNEEYTGIIKTNVPNFDTRFSAVWLKTHQFSYSYLREKIYQLTYQNFPEFMVSVTGALITFMQNLLYELHEIDSLLSDEDTSVFISFDDLCLDFNKIMPSNDNCLLLKRLSVYRIFKEFSDITIKDYSKNQILLNQNSARESICQMFEQNGYHVQEIK